MSADAAPEGAGIHPWRERRGNVNGWRVLGPGSGGAGEGEGKHAFNRRLKVTFSFQAVMMRSIGKLVL